MFADVIILVHKHTITSATRLAFDDHGMRFGPYLILDSDVFEVTVTWEVLRAQGR